MGEETVGDFIFGANLPWFEYGLDVGANAWRPAGGVGRTEARERATRELAALAETGVRTLRWFLFCDGRAGIRFDQRGWPIGLDDFVHRDIDAALELVGRERMSVMFVLLDFHWCRPARTADGVQVGGRARVLRDCRGRELLLEHVFRPVLEQYGSEASVFAWDIFNEPEWVASSGVKQFLREALVMIRSCSSRPVTIGSAGVRWRSWYRDLDVDFFQVHWYDSLERQHALGTPVATLGFDRPVLLGEFPTRGSRRGWQEILETARLAGYAGAFYWSALSNDACSDPLRRPVCKAGSSFPPPSSVKSSPP